MLWCRIENGRGEERRWRGLAYESRSHDLSIVTLVGGIVKGLTRGDAVSARLIPGEAREVKECSAISEEFGGEEEGEVKRRIVRREFHLTSFPLVPWLTRLTLGETSITVFSGKGRVDCLSRSWTGFGGVRSEAETSTARL